MHQIHEQQPLRNLTIDAPTNISSLSLSNSKLLNAKWAKLPSDQQILRGSIRSGENIGPNYPPQLPRLTKLDLSSLHTCRTSDPHQAPSIHTTRFSAPKPKIYWVKTRANSQHPSPRSNNEAHRQHKRWPLVKPRNRRVRRTVGPWLANLTPKK